MRIVIIEDERLTAIDLQQTIRQIDPSVVVESMLKSVAEARTYFEQYAKPDLVFSDIRLGDGLSFEIFDRVKVPVIFCTAYDEYALHAFRANGIDYILKPFTTTSVKEALQKFKDLTHAGQDKWAQQFESLKSMFTYPRPKITALLIHHKDMITPVSVEDVALFQLESDVVSLTTFTQKCYYPGKSLDELEELTGDDFFRVNRQYLINRKAIVNASSILSRKLSIALNIPHKESITISREKAPAFLKWLAGE